MANKVEVRQAAQALSKAVEAMLEETVPITPRPAVRYIKIMDNVSWPVVTRDEPNWHAVQVKGSAIGLTNTQTAQTDLADHAVSLTTREKDALVEGLKRATEIATRRAEERQEAARDILNSPEERAALRSLRAEYTLMQLEELNLE